MNNNITLHNFKNKQLLFKSIAENCANKLSQQIKHLGEASFIIPGGTTPSPAFKLLSNTDLPWDKITIAQSDERWVDANHSQSNEKLTRTSLLINQAKKANYISMKNDQATPFEGEQKTNQHYQNLSSPFTITMLGMGLDGHVASLFPGAKNIIEALSLTNENLCIAINAQGCPVAGDYPDRISLTLSAILNSTTIILLITGKEKMAVIQTALEKKPTRNLPVSYILHQTETPVEIFWSE